MTGSVARSWPVFAPAGGGWLERSAFMLAPLVGATTVFAQMPIR